jgi:hypothetical protein
MKQRIQDNQVIILDDVATEMEISYERYLVKNIHQKIIHFDKMISLWASGLNEKESKGMT